MKTNATTLYFCFLFICIFHKTRVLFICRRRSPLGNVLPETWKGIQSMWGLKAATENKSMAIKVSPRLTVSTVYNRECVMCSRTGTMEGGGNKAKMDFMKLLVSEWKHLFKTIFSQYACCCCCQHREVTLESEAFFMCWKYDATSLNYPFWYSAMVGWRKGSMFFQCCQQCCETKMNLRNFNTSFFESGKGEKVL